LKGKKPIYHTNNELEYELMLKSSFEDDELDFDEIDEKEARVCFNFI